MDYLRDYIDGKVVFSTDLKTMADDIKDSVSVLKFAMGRELESIAYYHEVKSFVPQKHYSHKLMLLLWKKGDILQNLQRFSKSKTERCKITLFFNNKRDFPWFKAEAGIGRTTFL